MPVVPSFYRAPAFLPGGHLQTIWPALFRHPQQVTTVPETLELPDGDFLQLDWYRAGNSKLAILSHGLEASSQAPYIQGMAGALSRNGWDVLAWNFRSCGSEPNRLLRSYHSGATEDLEAVIGHAIATHPAEEIDLMGFSLGGNLTLKYLGERTELPSQIHRAVAFSVPCDLASSAAALARPENWIYMKRFLGPLRKKMLAKALAFPDQLDVSGIGQIRTFQQFDDRFTGPIHGFRDADDYWTRSSSRQFLSNIKVPTLLVNAANDPFLSEACFPIEEAESSSYFHLEMPATGGHVGFPTYPNTHGWWSEMRAIEFLQSE
ncbi:alpha/beta fold hydrolase [Luteolibacter pohnpeiensis]|uniref:Alpha/beta fold hydrolase n=1 Tax=Luteolibacter pohnpeiensis TaxID=454153 RepID=A0A934SAL7_9BACT|nr:alpha/beta fold hydrolase [Luteolibacter pohnpeiensis]MBK1884460.1 alpha/beta fold hydrolase [Luteolibacter pohnpeiensis]